MNCSLFGSYTTKQYFCTVNTNFYETANIYKNNFPDV